MIFPKLNKHLFLIARIDKELQMTKMATVCVIVNLQVMILLYLVSSDIISGALN